VIKKDKVGTSQGTAQRTNLKASGPVGKSNVNILSSPLSGAPALGNDENANSQLAIDPETLANISNLGLS